MLEVLRGTGMEAAQVDNHLFESGLGSGVLVYVVDDCEPVCIRFSSLVKLQVLFDIWSNSAAADEFKANPVGSDSVLEEIDGSVVVAAESAGPISKVDVCDDPITSLDDVGDESQPEGGNQSSDSSKFKPKRKRSGISENSDLSRKVTRTRSEKSFRYDSRCNKKQVTRLDREKQKHDETAQENDIQHSNNIVNGSQCAHNDSTCDRKLRSANRISKLNDKLPSNAKSSKTARTILKSKMRKKTAEKKCLFEQITSPSVKLEEAEDVNQVKERQRKLLIEKPITCDYCMVNFKNKQAYYDHRRVEESVHTCGICGKVEPYEAHLIVHMQKHRRSKSGASLGSHDKSNSSTEPLADPGHKYFPDSKKTHKEKMKCNVCGLVVSSMDSLKIHSFLHTGEYAYRCCVCEETFTSLSSRQHHMDIHVSAQRFRCNPCGERFTSRADLAKHQLTHEIKCALCGEVFPNKTSRTCHFRVSHPNDILKCFLCSNLFATTEDLERHLAYHKKGRKEQCPVCGVVVSKLKDHMLMHSHIAQEKLYACDQCPMRYLRKSNLDRHMRTHTGEKPYACNRCPKSFRSNGMLRKHLLTHTKERPYQCEVCGKQCSLRSNLNIHMRVHNSDRHFSCALCSQAFNHKNSLHGHMKSKHAHDMNTVENKLNMPSNLPRQAPPNMVSEFDKHLAFSDKHYQNLDMPVGISQNIESELQRVDKFGKHQDCRHMQQSHMDFSVAMPDHMASSLYIDSNRLAVNKYDLHVQPSQSHGY